MNIKFNIDVEKKRVHFFYKNGELKALIEKLMKKFPELTTEEISLKGSSYITDNLTLLVKEICENHNVTDWKSFKPSWISYSSEKELPRELREQEI